MTKCRVCGADRAELEDKIDDLRAELRDLRAAMACDLLPPASLHLTSAETRALTALFQRRRVSKESLADVVVKNLDACMDPDNVLKTIICRLRSKLRPLGIEIATIWNQGYELQPVNLAKVGDLLNANGPPEKPVLHSTNQSAGG